MSGAFASRLALVLFLTSSASIACRADKSVLDTIFSCDPEAGDAQCGTDENGDPMTCYVGSAQLGGEAFCTKTCDPARHADPGSLCTSSGALLERCDPAEEGNCPSPLNCYRTDILFDDGLCSWVPVCPFASDEDTLDDSQCGLSHPVCAGDLLRELAVGTALEGLVRTNNLHCVSEPPCALNECPGTGLAEVCPSAFFATDFGLPITCAAPCDRFACPPNFTCAKSSGPGSPLLCLPGVPGARCTSSEDCLVGDCLDTGAGFSICTLPTVCDSDDDCLIHGSSPPFVCVEGIPGAGAHCVSTIPFHGANCEDSSDCSEELLCGSEPCPPRECSQHSAFVLNPDHGECRFFACDSSGKCPAFGGLPHACLEDGSCFPGIFGVPCSSSSDCFANLTCETVPPDGRSRTDDENICTTSCSDDDDCTSAVNPWLAGGGYCVPAPNAPPDTVGFCRAGAQPDRPCDKPAHCLSHTCVLTEGGSRVCGPL
jgi:hypothetical protein